MASRLNWRWLPVYGLLLIAIVTSGIIAWSKYRPAQSIEILLLSEPPPQGKVYIGGSVTNPGYYPLTGDDNVQDLLRNAGGAAVDNQTELKLYVGTGAPEGQTPQKVNINTAEPWLLQALPGIGETLAQRIVDYRQQNGPFQNTQGLLNVPGIGAGSYEHLKDLITVEN